MMNDLEEGAGGSGASSSVFERYDEEFQTLTNQIETSLEQEPPSPYLRALLQQCDDLLKQMALEARSNKKELKQTLLVRVKEYKVRHTALVQQSERQGLLSQSSGGQSVGRRERERLQQNETMLANQNDTLERARRTMQETEQVALEITEELGHNREKLMSAHSRVREVSSLGARARRILAGMSQREMQQKMILYAIAGGLGLAFLFMIWAFWRA